MTQEGLHLNHEGHEVHEGGAEFTTQFPQRHRDAEDDDCLAENTQRVGVLPSCMSKAKEPLSQRHKVAETQEDLRLNHVGHEVHEGGAGFTTNFRRGAGAQREQTARQSRD